MTQQEDLDSYQTFLDEKWKVVKKPLVLTNPKLKSLGSPLIRLVTTPIEAYDLVMESGQGIRKKMVSIMENNRVRKMFDSNGIRLFFNYSFSFVREITCTTLESWIY